MMLPLFINSKNLYHSYFSFFKYPTITNQQKKVALAALAFFGVLTIAISYRNCLSSKKELTQGDKQPLTEKKEGLKLLSEGGKKIPTIGFVTRNPGPAHHFQALGGCLDKKQYQVYFIAAEAALKKLQEHSIPVSDFNPQSLDSTREDVQMYLAQQITQICTNYDMVIADVGDKISYHLGQALTKNKKQIFATYYDNPEKWVSKDYASMVSHVAQVSQAMFFANNNLANEWPYQNETTPMDLNHIPCFGVGYQPAIELAEKLRKDRLNKQTKDETRRVFFESLGIQDRGQKILVHLGENNFEYFNETLLQFEEFLSAEGTDLSHIIVLIQPHPNAPSDKKQEKSLIEKVSKRSSGAPLCALSKLDSFTSLILADAVVGRQTSMTVQIVLAKIPYMQVGRKPYVDVLVRNKLCPIATTLPDFLNALNQIFDSSSDHLQIEEFSHELGIRKDWAQNFDAGVQSLLQTNSSR